MEVVPDQPGSGDQQPQGGAFPLLRGGDGSGHHPDEGGVERRHAAAEEDLRLQPERHLGRGGHAAADGAAEGGVRAGPGHGGEDDGAAVRVVDEADLGDGPEEHVEEVEGHAPGGVGLGAGVAELVRGAAEAPVRVPEALGRRPFLGKSQCPTTKMVCKMEAQMEYTVGTPIAYTVYCTMFLQHIWCQFVCSVGAY